MAEHDHDQALDHDYDGIKELDNLLPRWWLYLFYLTIVFSVLYMAYYHVLGIGLTQEEEYKRELDSSYQPDRPRNPLVKLQQLGYHTPWHSPEADRMRQDIMAGLAPDEPEVVEVDTTPIVFEEPLSDSASLEAGKKIYMTNCASCHANDGGGGIGPNMTDDFWLHGNSFADTVKVVVEGVPVKGMIAWRGQLNPEQIHQVSSYLYSLRGTTPAKPKGPQGQEY